MFIFILTLYSVYRNKYLVGDDQASLGESVTVVDLSVLAKSGYSV